MNMLALGTINARYKSFLIGLPAVFKNLVLRSLQKVVDILEVISLFSYTVINNRWFIAPLSALVKKEQQQLLTKQEKIKNKRW